MNFYKCPLSQRRVQMNYIFSDNVRILCLFCNAKKKARKNCQIVWKEQKHPSFSSVLIMPSVKSALILLPFLVVALYESGTRKLYLGQWPYWKIFSQCNLTAQIEQVQDRSNLVRATSLCIKYTHGHNIRKQDNCLVFGSKKTKGLNRIACGDRP